MAKDDSEDLMKALMKKLYSQITGNDGNVKIPRNKYVSWLMPGMPFTERDFLFCSKGIIGSSAEETNDLAHQAWTISRLFDYVPDIPDTSINNFFADGGKLPQTVYMTTQDS